MTDTIIEKIIEPLEDFVLVKHLRQSKTPSGVILPDTVEQKNAGHIVKAIGSKVNNVQKGDKIIFGGKVFKLIEKGVEEDLYLVKAEQIVARITDKKKIN